MAGKVWQKEYDKWVDSDVETALIELKNVDDKTNVIKFVIGPEEQRWSINVNPDYPAVKGKLRVTTSDSKLTEWQTKLDELSEKKSYTLTQLLTQAAELYLKYFPDENEDPDSDGAAVEDDPFGGDSDPDVPKVKAPRVDPAISKMDDMSQYLSIGSAGATLRLIKDLKNIKSDKSETLGFSAEPVVDKGTGLLNLYHWTVRLFDFDKKSDLYKDFEKFRKSKGQDYISIEMRFSKDYPFVPPFVRVISPRFAFRTGHVTVGGSICMELLTNTGWRSTNDIESILIQIRAELLEGGGRLDPAGGYEYNESEAWDAFYRAARTHSWDVNGLSSSMFPTK